jgi:hypothetical protein
LDEQVCQDNKVWQRTKEEPLFILENGRPLDNKTMITWLRNMGKKVRYPNAEKLSGISFEEGEHKL